MFTLDQKSCCMHWLREAEALERKLKAIDSGDPNPFLAAHDPKELRRKAEGLRASISRYMGRSWPAVLSYERIRELRKEEQSDDLW